MLFQFLCTVMYAVTQWGCLKLLDGYMYTQQNEGLNHIVWHCHDRGMCAAWIWLHKLPSEKVTRQISHSHPPDWQQCHLAIQTAVQLTCLASLSPANSTNDILTLKWALFFYVFHPVVYKTILKWKQDIVNTTKFIIQISRS
jgi:hypothetical protein